MSLPTDFVRPTQIDYAGAVASIDMDGELLDDIKPIAKHTILRCLCF